MTLFRLTPPRREMLLTSSLRDPVHPDSADLELSIEEAELARLLPERGVRIRPTASISEADIGRLENLELRRSPAAYAQLLDLSPYRAIEQYRAAGILSRRPREKLDRALRIFREIGGRVEVIGLDAIDSARFGSLHADLLLPFYMSRCINPYWTGFPSRFLEFMAAQAATHLGQAVLVQLLIEDKLLGCLLGRIARPAEWLAFAAQSRTDGAASALALRWERPLTAGELIFDVVLVASSPRARLPAELRAELPRLPWWYSIAWAIESGISLFSGGIDCTDTPFLRDEYLNVVATKAQLGMTCATLWSDDGLLWRPDRLAFFMTRSSAMWVFLEKDVLLLELLLSSSPLGLCGLLATSNRHIPSRRIHVMTRRDAAEVERLCARAGVAAEVLIGPGRIGLPARSESQQTAAERAHV